MTQPDVRFIDEATSTNTLLKAMAADSLSGVGHGFTLVARRQSAGRGQRGNSWEAEPGKNLTLSMLLTPTGVPAARQFAISEAVAVAAADTLNEWLPDQQKATIKWPNDIYVGNRKIAGILIEHSLAGNGIQWSVCGIGININQRQFHSDAPNPVSLINITGHETATESILHAFAARVMSLSASYLENSEAPLGQLHQRYLDLLWRREGTHPYRDMTRDGRLFLADILDVEPSGHLILREPDGAMHRFAFKEVAVVIDSLTLKN